MQQLAFYDTANFSFISELESYWHEIYEEFCSIQDYLIDYVEPKLFDQGWKVFGLWNLPHREPLSYGVIKCPRTAAIIERLIPSHGAVAFSVMNPGTHIRPHSGKPGPYLRCHLGLEVPLGDCKLRVLDTVHRWEPGRAMVFDDRLEHEAWNYSTARRVVLLFDFIPDSVLTDYQV